jgi:hypothetical protein
MHALCMDTHDASEPEATRSSSPAPRQPRRSGDRRRSGGSAALRRTNRCDGYRRPQCDLYIDPVTFVSNSPVLLLPRPTEAAPSPKPTSPAPSPSSVSCSSPSV